MTKAMMAHVAELAEAKANDANEAVPDSGPEHYRRYAAWQAAEAVAGFARDLAQRWDD